MIKLFFILILFIPSLALGADYYVAQTAAGSGDASSCANAKALTWNWTTPNVAGDDTVHLCGTLTGQLIVATSGTSNHPITVKFETGAKFSTSTWTTGGAYARIYGSAKSYITIDGGTNGIIEATDNGTSRTNQIDLHGIFFENGANNIEIKNLTIQNLYVRTGTSERNSYGMGIRMIGDTSVIKIHDCVFNWMLVAVAFGFDTSSDLKVYNNTFTNTNRSITGGTTGGTSVASGIHIYNNTASAWEGWDQEPDNDNHHNFVHIWNQQAGASVSDINIYGNTIHGGYGSRATSAIYLEHTTTSTNIYNNLFYSDDASNPADGLLTIDLESIDYLRIMNNTFIGNGSGIAINLTVKAINGGGARPLIENNIFYDFGTIIYENGSDTDSQTWAGTSNYNDIYSSDYANVMWRSIPYSSTNGTFTECETVTGGSSGATAKFWRLSGGNLQVREQTGAFTAGGERITGLSSGAYVNTTAGTGSGSISNGQLGVEYWMAQSGANAVCKEANSITSTPGLDGSYKPGVSSAVKDAGTSLATYFTTDKDGATRSGTWDIGAYEYAAGGDTTPPAVTFSIPSSNVGYVVPLTFSCTDAVGVTGYCVQESDSVGSCSWVGSAPATFTFTTQGSKTLYAACRDAIPNTSAMSSDSVTVTSGRGATFTVR